MRKESETKSSKNLPKRIAIIGGGPSGIFMYKRLVESEESIEVAIFERKNTIGGGMPYSREGANHEHVTNVSDNEIPEMVNSIAEWTKIAPKKLLDAHQINPDSFNEYKVLPRLFFGEYLSAQFELLQEIADMRGIRTHVYIGTTITDISDKPEQDEVWLSIQDGDVQKFDRVILCTGHHWPKKHEGKIPNYFDSPYPPQKLKMRINNTVAIRGSSLTAIDALRTISRSNGSFSKDGSGKLKFQLSDESPNFKIILHSRNGLLPAVRFHLEDTHLQNDAMLTDEEINDHKAANDGFLSLDFLFGKDFKEPIRLKDPEFYEKIRHLNMEAFVDKMMEFRESLDPFILLRAEFVEAEKSIKRHESVYWKEVLAELSFAMNYPAKYFSAEDMLRLRKTLMPLISVIIAFVPQASCAELLALHDAGVLELISVGQDSEIKPLPSGGIIYEYTDEQLQQKQIKYHTFIDCIGQPHLSYNDFPFHSLIAQKTIAPAMLRFRDSENAVEAMESSNQEVFTDASGNCFLEVPGIAINDRFQVLNPYGAFNERIYMMAVPFIGGFNPDYSGLDFCEEASGRIIDSLFPNS